MLKRWLPCTIGLVLLVLMSPGTSYAPGTASVPNIIANLSGNVNASLLDANWTSLVNYINNREVASGTLAARPAASISGRWYFATDANGGTLYFDTGSAWTQIAPGVTNIGVLDQISSCTLSNDATNPGGTLDISACSAASDDTAVTSRVLMSLTTAYTKLLTATFAVGTGNGCLDTGTVAASTWYHVFEIFRTDTSVTDYLCSTSPTNPTMPTSYNRRRRIGSILTDGSRAINFFTQFGREFVWATPSALNVDDTNGGTAAITATATTPNLVATKAFLNAYAQNGSAAFSIYVSPMAAADTAPSLTASPLGSLAASTPGTTSILGGQVSVWTNTSRQFRFRMSASGASNIFRIVTLGWYDPMIPGL